MFRDTYAAIWTKQQLQDIESKNEQTPSLNRLSFVEYDSVMLLFMIFAVFDVGPYESLRVAVKMYINYSFFYI